MMNQFEHGGNLYRFKRTGDHKLLDFSANINPLGLSLKVKQAIEDQITEIIHYPDSEGYALKQALSQQYCLKNEQIVLGNGAVELLYILCHQLQPKKVLIPAPSFSEYERAARSVNAEIHYDLLTAENGFKLDSNLLAAKLSPYNILFIGNPNNPTGTLLTIKEIETILNSAKLSNTFVVIDESFIDFITNGEAYTAKHFIADYDNLLILHSLTKFYAIPGLRLGFAATNESLAQKLHLAKDPWNVNSLAQIAGVSALADESYQQASRSFIYHEIRRFTEKLNQFKMLTIYPPSVNFVLVDIQKTGFTAPQFRDLCLKENILIRDCSNYPGLSADYVRFAIKSTKENNYLYQVLEKILCGDQND